ncbi:MAG: glycoside hydrolase family 88 protein [Bifidobacteriaceae bacterium]|jgi:unsaturated rhamnogalacturonyl hydrolase|nr:glycoside hydrolase family 88 protein [Bifidobacteriaceae bacterium]
MKVWPVADNPLLRAPERFISRGDIKELVRRLTDALVNIKEQAGESAIQLDDGRVVDGRSWAGWEWPQGVGLYGIWQYYRLTGDASMREVVERWFADQFRKGAAPKNVNTMAALLTLAYVYEESGERTLLPYLDAWAEWVMRRMPRTPHAGLQHITCVADNHYQLWADTLMMTVLPLAKIGRVLGRPEYLDEAVYQFLLHANYLQDRQSGLWFHGWTFDGNHSFARARWARGNAWATIAIPDFLELMDLPEGNSARRFLLEVLDSQAAALGGCQADNGMWHTLLDDPSAYVESSATAGFAYGLAKSVRLGYLDSSYLPVAERAVRAVTEHISPDGELLQVSGGTFLADDLDYSRHVELASTPYGQAMAMLCLAEYLRTYY